MNIVLGVFCNEESTFNALRKKTNADAFGDFVNDVTFHNDCILDRVHSALIRCKTCHFDVSSVKFELELDSFTKYTLMELHLVITTPEFLDKTIFYKNGIVIKKETVINWFLFDKYWNQFL